MDDFLKEAIADARAVRETALQNAKIALEEAFNPHVKAMLAKQIQTEMEDDEEEVDFDEEGDEEEFGSEEDGEEEIAVEPEEGEDEFGEEEAELEFDDEEEVEESDDFDADDIGGDSDPEEEEDELDLEATIRELEADLEDEDEEVDFATEGEDEEELDFDVEDDEEIDENDVSSEIGTGDNKQPGKANQTSGIGSVGKAKLKEDEDEDEDDFDLQELISQLIDEEDELEDEESTDELEIENAKLKRENKEYRDAVTFLRDKINEVNLLNSKLLYTNRLFKSFELDTDKKYKVVETFDRAKNIREVKLIFSTIAESFGARATKKNKIVENKVRKPAGGSSKAVTSTKPKTKILEENVDLKSRYQKLANIKTK